MTTVLRPADRLCVECGVRQTSQRRCSECAERLAAELDRFRNDDGPEAA